MSHNFDFNVAVIGGGSGGLACAKACARAQGRVCVFDFVKPSPQGTKWGLGGTCVNVGCVPKKLMHYAAKMGPILGWDAPKMGWGEFSHTDEFGEHEPEEKQINWTAMVQVVQNYVKQLNFSYRTGLRSTEVTYFNNYAQFKGPNTIVYKQGDEIRTVTAQTIIIAVGGRPIIPSEVPGAVEFAITSDDIFSRKKAPGKTLVVGASYIALECAGFLTEMGFDVSVAVRSILLRGFDRQCAEKVGLCLREMGTKFLKETLVTKLEKNNEGKIVVSFSNAEGTHTDTFDTVMYATGRYADVSGLDLAKVGVKCTKEGRIICTAYNQTSVPGIYAIGDVVDGFPELTPAAIGAGESLARKLFLNSNEDFDIRNIPTAVFTPFEYGCVGLTEEQAIEKYGEDDLEVYISEFSPLELSAVHRRKVKTERLTEADVDITPPCLSKLVCVRSEEERVVGIHFVGPNAGEIIQGMAIALKLKAKKSDFDGTTAIHPTDAESFVQLTVTRRSGEAWMASGGCGGGKCG